MGSQFRSLVSKASISTLKSFSGSEISTLGVCFRNYTIQTGWVSPNNSFVRRNRDYLKYQHQLPTPMDYWETTSLYVVRLRKKIWPKTSARIHFLFIYADPVPYVGRSENTSKRLSNGAMWWLRVASGWAILRTCVCNDSGVCVGLWTPSNSRFVCKTMILSSFPPLAVSTLHSDTSQPSWEAASGRYVFCKLQKLWNNRF